MIDHLRRPSSAQLGTLLIVLAALFCHSGRLVATTIVPPKDLAELALSSDAVVLAAAQTSTPFPKGPLTFTATEFAVDRSLSGEAGPGSRIQVEVPGGASAGEGWFVPGAPRFEAGRRYLLFLDRRPDGTWLPVTLAYGLLEEGNEQDGTRILAPLPEAKTAALLRRPDGVPVEEIVPCRAEALLEHLGQVIRRTASWDVKAVAAGPGDALGTAALAPSQCAFFNQDGMNFRWHVFDSGGSATIYADSSGDPSVPGDTFRNVQEAVNLWMDIPGTSLNLIYGGPQDVRLCQGEDERGDMIYFDDPCSSMADMENCAGVLAVGGPYAAGTHAFDGSSWITCTGWRVIVNNGAGCIGDNAYRIMLAHELGHGLGFGHTEDSGSLMYAYCCQPMNSTDIACTRYTYPPLDPANQRPVVDAGSSATVALAGNALLLEGTATDDGLPTNPGSLTTAWSKLGGPGVVTFADPSAIETTASFSRSGTYIIGLTASDGQLLYTDAITISVDAWAGTKSSVTFQQGAGGYSGTVDTFVQESASTAQNGASTTLSVDADDPGGSGLETQGLLRFDEIFGAGTDQIPPGAAVLSAWLELNTTDAGSGATIYRMRTAWEDTASWSRFGTDGIKAGSEAEAQAEETVVGSSGVRRIDVTRSLAAWSADPCSTRGWVFLPTGDGGWDFSSAEGDVPPRLTVEYLSYREEKIIARGDTWRYFKGKQAPPAAWKEPSFAPGAGWLSGRTGIGYGDGDDATVLGDMEGSYPSIFCRYEFSVADASAIGRLLLSIDYDDGFVAYLNGEEAARSASLGLPGTPVGWNDGAESREAGTVEEYLLPAELLLSGKNVLAIEVHNSDAGSSDLSFIPELTASFLFIDGGASWRFLRGSGTVPASWKLTDFDDSAWELGPASIGYGDGDDLTELADMEDGYLAIFCRKSFQVADPALLDQLMLSVLYDDGLVAYLNGVEVGRANMPAGTPTAATEASSGIEPSIAQIKVPASRLRTGKNVLAVSVHNSDLGSSDLTFSAALFPLSLARRVVDCDALIRRGDISSDGDIDISDAVQLLFHLFVSGAEIACQDAADFDDDGALAIADAIGILGFLFRGGPRPSSPGLLCGKDPTPDDFDDCSTLGCK